jgi:hypothetical protein
MSSSRGRSPCDTGPRELQLDVIRPGTLASLATERNPGSIWLPNVLKAASSSLCWPLWAHYGPAGWGYRSDEIARSTLDDMTDRTRTVSAY